MAQIIQSNDIFGKIGRGFGQGLGEQIPKEVQRERLSAGLRKLGEESGNLNQMEILTRAAGIPGITPQMVQSIGELARFQGKRNAFMKQNREQQDKQPFSKGIQETKFGGEIANRPNRNMPNTEQGLEEQNLARESGHPQVNTMNPTAENMQPARRWTQQRKEQDISRILQENQHFTYEEAYARSDKNEQRELAAPEAEKARYEQAENARVALQNKIDKQLRKKLHIGNEEDLQEKITGDNLVRIERLVEQDLRINPGLSESDAINHRTQQVLDFDKSKTNLKELSSRPFLDKIIPVKNKETVDNLYSISETFAGLGNQEELYNILKNKGPGGFGTSRMTAAHFAYKLTPDIKKYVNGIKIPRSLDYIRHAKRINDGHSRKYAVDILGKLTGNDSIQAIAFQLNKNDPDFNQQEFYDELRLNRSKLASDFQKRELGEGVSDKFYDWGDFSLVPWLKD